MLPERRGSLESSRQACLVQLAGCMPLHALHEWREHLPCWLGMQWELHHVAGQLLPDACAHLYTCCWQRVQTGFRCMQAQTGS